MSARERVAEALAAIRDQSQLGAFWAVDEERALRAAAEVDRDGAGARPLAGVAVAVKDCFDVAGLPTTGGIPGAAPPARRDAEVVRRLRAAGAVPVGKAAMDELGWSTNGSAPGRPPCLHPRDAARTPGGSSAGSAVAVAASMAPLAIGSDTAGSVRIPASYCGVVGFKPALGAVPRRGLAATVASLETPGLLARSVELCRRGYEALTRRPVPAAPGPLVVGRLDDLFDAADPEVGGIAHAALERLAGAHRVEPTRLDWRPRGLGRLFAAELHRSWGERVRSAPGDFTADIRASEELGATVSEAEREELLASLRRARRRMRRRLAAYDVVASPTVPHPVPPAGAASVADASRFTLAFNALGWPAISVPCGDDADGLPVGLQLAAPPGRLPALLAAAAAVERAGSPVA